MPDLPKATSRFLRLPAIDGKRTDYKDVHGSRVPGLMLRVSPTAKSWVLAARMPGVKNPARFTLGSLDELTLTEARQAAQAMKSAVRDGRDPQAERKARSAAAAEARVDLIDAHIEKFAEHCIKTNRTGEQQARTMRLVVKPAWKGRHISTITRRDVKALIDAKAEDAPIMANRLLALVRPFFAWAVERDLVSDNPAAGIKPVGKEKSRDRVLSDDELLRVWKAAGATAQPFGPVFQLLLLTAQRLNEAAGMRWSELDLDAAEWVISGERAKNGRENAVPLSARAVAILRDQKKLKGSDFVFPSARSPAEKSVSGFSKAKAALDKTSNVNDWRLHDLRRTTATGLARMKIAPHVIEKLLNHANGVIGGVTARYNRYSYDDEKRHALDAWAAHLERLETGGELDNVVPLAAVADA